MLLKCNAIKSMKILLELMEKLQNWYFKYKLCFEVPKIKFQFYDAVKIQN